MAEATCGESLCNFIVIWLPHFCKDEQVQDPNLSMVGFCVEECPKNLRVCAKKSHNALPSTHFIA